MALDGDSSSTYLATLDGRTMSIMATTSLSDLVCSSTLVALSSSSALLICQCSPPPCLTALLEIRVSSSGAISGGRTVSFTSNDTFATFTDYVALLQQSGQVLMVGAGLSGPQRVYVLDIARWQLSVSVSPLVNTPPGKVYCSGAGALSVEQDALVLACNHLGTNDTAFLVKWSLSQLSRAPLAYLKSSVSSATLYPYFVNASRGFYIGNTHARLEYVPFDFGPSWQTLGNATVDPKSSITTERLQFAIDSKERYMYVLTEASEGARGGGGSGNHSYVMTQLDITQQPAPTITYQLAQSTFGPMVADDQHLYLASVASVVRFQVTS
jgi:hypothetical protein